MNAQLKQHIQKRNELRIDLRSNRKQLLETNSEITRLTEESKQATWHRHLDRISKSNNANGRETHTTGKSLLYKRRVYASDRAKASADVQVYAKINGRKSYKDIRKVDMDLRCPKRSKRTTRGSRSKRPSPLVNLSRRFLSKKPARRQALMA